MAQALGVCSPITTCRKDTTDTAATDATVARERNASAVGSAASQFRSSTATVSSATYPSRMEATVMPSWAADSWRYRSCSAAWTFLAFRYAKDLASRDVVSRAMTTEIKEGRGCG